MEIDVAQMPVCLLSLVWLSRTMHNKYAYIGTDNLL